MIWIKDVKDKFCFNCNKPKDDAKNIMFSVKDNTSSFTTICLCLDCRKELVSALYDDIDFGR